MVEKSKIFLSYAREDLQIAGRLYKNLTHYGLNVWFDKTALFPGQKWKYEIRKAIKESDYFIVLLSSKSVSKRGFCQNEVKKALEILHDFPESEIFIIPIRLDECVPSHERLKDLQWLDLFESYEIGVKNILKFMGINIKSKKMSVITEEEISNSDSEELEFREIEITLSETWDKFLEWLSNDLNNARIKSIQEDENRELSFYCSGRPGHLMYPILVICEKEGLPIKYQYDLVNDWLLPLALKHAPSNFGIPWDSGLFPFKKDGEKEVIIKHPLAECRDCHYWVLFANKKKSTNY